MVIFYCIARKPAQEDRFIYDTEKSSAEHLGAQKTEKQEIPDASKTVESAERGGADIVEAQKKKLAAMMGMEKSAREATESVDKTETAEQEIGADKPMFVSPEVKLQDKVEDYNKLTQELHASGREISASIVKFQKVCQRFEDGKKEWSVFLRGSPFVDDDETEQLKHQLQILRRSLAQKMHDLRIKQHQFEEEGKDLVEQGKQMRTDKEEEKNKLLRNVDSAQKEKIEAHYNEMLSGLDEVNIAVIENVASNTVANNELINSVDQQVGFLNSIDIEMPGVWDASAGLLFNKIGEGSTLLTRELICQSALDPLSRYIKKHTKDIPVVNVLADTAANVMIDLPSGVIEGTGELVSGVATMAAHPVEATKGVAALAGRNPRTGEWTFSQMGDTWSELGKASIAYENFEKGQWGKGVGKVALNALLTATGAGAAAKGAQGASLAYAVSRAAGAGVARSTARAAGTGAGIFVGEFSGGVSKLPGEAVSAVGKLLKAPVKLAENLRLDKASRIGKQIAEIKNELAKAKIVFDDASANLLASALEKIDPLKKGIIPGKLVNKIMSGELVKLSPAELAKIGINTPKQLSNFIKYREAIKTSERLTANIEYAERILPYAKISPELTKLPVLKGKKLDQFIEKFNKQHPDGFENGPKYRCLSVYDDGTVIAFDETGKLRKFESVQKFVEGKANFDELIFMQKREFMAKVSEQFRAMSAEDLRNLSAEEICARATHGVPLSDGQIRLVKSKIEDFKQQIKKADDFANADHTTQVKKVEDIFEYHGSTLDHPEAVRIITGVNNMPSSVLIIVDSEDFLRVNANETRSWNALTEQERAMIYDTHGEVGGVAMSEIMIIPHRTVEANLFDYVVSHELEHYVNNLFGMGIGSNTKGALYGQRASQAFKSGRFEEYIQLDMAHQLSLVGDEVIAFLTDPHYRNNPRGLYDNFTQGHYRWSIDEGYGRVAQLVHEGKINLDRPALNRVRQADHAFRKQYEDIVDAGLRSAVEILQYPQGHEMMRLMPIEQWPRVLEYLRGRTG